MKAIKLVCAFLLPLAVLSCSDGNATEEEIMTEKIQIK